MTPAGLTIRPQTSQDPERIAAINSAAFAEHGGTRAFDEFRRTRTDIISLVAWEKNEPLGHVLFSPVAMQTPQGAVAGMVLGQLAVLPEHQNKGIGTLLAETGIKELRNAGCPFIIVVGHAAYYPRFGFEPGDRHGVKCQWSGVPPETFMVLYLDEDKKDSLTGTACFDGL